MAQRGWMPIDLARAARVNTTRVYRFLNGEVTTVRTLKLLAHALGYSPRRYLLPARKGHSLVRPSR